jgi:hypothetical protein
MLSVIAKNVSTGSVDKKDVRHLSEYLLNSVRNYPWFPSSYPNPIIITQVILITDYVTETLSNKKAV